MLQNLEEGENVSRETFLRLQHYVDLLQKWNRSINLIGKASETEIWQRHIRDSLQLGGLLGDEEGEVADLGSGAGLPGMVLAIAQPKRNFSLIEQDKRKAAFLQEICGILHLENITVLNCDLHQVTAKYTVVTARALAPLATLCGMAYPRMRTDSLCLFPKGRSFAKELVEAEKNWRFSKRIVPSQTDPNSAILCLTNLAAI